MWRKVIPSSMIGQITMFLALSFFLLLGSLFVLKFYENKDLPHWVLNEEEVTKQLFNWKHALPLLKKMDKTELQSFINSISTCHEGYRVSDQAYDFQLENDETKQLSQAIAQMFELENHSVRAGFTTLDRKDFSYAKCPIGAIDLPVDGIVISMRLSDRYWLHREIHPHEWHLTDEMKAWFIRSLFLFIMFGGIASLFIYRLGKPLRQLTKSAHTFGHTFEVTETEEKGPHDIRQIIHTFNKMQENITLEVKKRLMALAAISHDVRSPLTALRVKAELVAGDEQRAELILSINKMEKVVGNALSFLRGDVNSEPKRLVELCSLIESECLDYITTGNDVSYTCTGPVKYKCRPDGLAQAIRNLIDNALKYAGSCNVSLEETATTINIIVSDNGPGIPAKDRQIILNPFERLSSHKNNSKGGFGLGLAIVEAVCKNHEGYLELKGHSDNTPGLVAVIKLPKHCPHSI